MYTTTSFSCYNIFNFSCPFHTVLIPPGQGFQRNIYPVSYPAHGYSINDSDVRSFQRSYKKTTTYFGFYARKNEIPKNMGKILYQSQNGQNKNFNKVRLHHCVSLSMCVYTAINQTNLWCKMQIHGKKRGIHNFPDVARASLGSCLAPLKVNNCGQSCAIGTSEPRSGE